jgi:hypothetical protein
MHQTVTTEKAPELSRKMTDQRFTHIDLIRTAWNLRNASMSDDDIRKMLSNDWNASGALIQWVIDEMDKYDD